MIIELPFLAPSINQCYYTDKNSFTRHKSKGYRDFLSRCKYFIIMPEKQFNEEIGVEINLWVPDKRRRDIDNQIKPILDMLVFFNIIKDDSLIQKLHVEKYYRKDNPETVIQIKSVKNESS